MRTSYKIKKCIIFGKNGVMLRTPDGRIFKYKSFHYVCIKCEKECKRKVTAKIKRPDIIVYGKHFCSKRSVNPPPRVELFLALQQNSSKKSRSTVVNYSAAGVARIPAITDVTDSDGSATPSTSRLSMRNESTPDVDDGQQPSASHVADSIVTNTENQHLPPLITAVNCVRRASSNIITEGDGRDDEDGEEENSNELSVVTIPDNTETVDIIQAKSDSILNVPMETGLNHPNIVQIDDNNVDEEMELDEKYDPVLFTFSSGVAKIKNACKKLDLAYSQEEVFQFWGTINIEHVRCNSSNIVSGPRLNGFECLALFFTGSHANCYELCFKVSIKLENDAFLKAQYNDSQRLKMSHTFCESHLKLITSWLNCKIGIYENGILQKYGKWHQPNEASDLVILIKKEGDLYAPILELD